jgi:hypothetical protein
MAQENPLVFSGCVVHLSIKQLTILNTAYNNIMKITRTSPFTGKVHVMEIDITTEQIKRWKEGDLIQRVAPHLTADEREFMLTGVPAEEWPFVDGADDFIEDDDEVGSWV